MATVDQYLPIYILRSRCKDCRLDTMRAFVKKDKSDVKDAYFQLELNTKSKWKKERHCEHLLKFTHIIDRDYHYSTKLKKAVKK